MLGDDREDFGGVLGDEAGSDAADLFQAVGVGGAGRGFGGAEFDRNADAICLPPMIVAVRPTTSVSPKYMITAPPAIRITPMPERTFDFVRRQPFPPTFPTKGNVTPNGLARIQSEADAAEV